MRRYSFLDQLIMGADQALRTVIGKPSATHRPNPADAAPDTGLSDRERQLAARLMRINHTGEICAQALYQGQALSARSSQVREKLDEAALEEGDHLNWCKHRIQELGGRTSLLNPAFYAGSFAIGAFAGFMGDRWSLGFLAETEHQVTRHLEGHLTRLSTRDRRSRAILEQMKRDEQDHAYTAIRGGGAPLPAPVKGVMQLASKVMTGSSYWV